MSLLSMGNGALSDLPDGDGSWGRFKTLLDEQNEWPTRYTFKFIVPAEQIDEVKAVFGGHPVRVRESSKGTYKSVTARVQMTSSDAVVDVYKEASSIEGIIPL
jgi:putative lipoic acid-binding regulatory protein